MRKLVIALVATCTVLPLVSAADVPQVETYLHQGRYAAGAQALEFTLEQNPKDDQARFGLGLLQFVRAIERLGQGLYEYGAKTESKNIPFLRLPVPHNLNPAPMTYVAFRRLLDDFYRELQTAEKTLAAIQDDNVKLKIRLADIRMDLDANGKADDRFLDIIKKFMGNNLEFLKKNKDFTVCFDRGDVAWFRAYCHLLMGALDLYCAINTQEHFEMVCDELFENPKVKFNLSQEEKWQKLRNIKEITFSEPKRLEKFRRHWIQVADLNVETWKYIMAETDNDYEWLPNPKQNGVIGLPVQKDMIDAWLGVMAELKNVLEGKKTFTISLAQIFVREEKGFNLKLFLQDPPDKLSSENFEMNLAEKYFTPRKDFDLGVLITLWNLFQGNGGLMGYAVYFN